MLNTIFLTLVLGCAHSHGHKAPYYKEPPTPKRAHMTHQHKHGEIVWVWKPAHHDRNGVHTKGHWEPHRKPRR